MNYRFANQDAFLLLWLVPVIFGLSVYLYRQQKDRLRDQLGVKGYPFLTSSVSKAKRKWKIALEISAIMFFVIALARPQAGQSTREVKSEGVDLMLLIDVSRSMMATDVRPSRLDLAKRELIHLIERGSGDRVGLIAFAGSAALLSPVTVDTSALKMFIESLGPESVSTQGTNFKQALEEAEAAFKGGGKEDDGNSIVTRAVVIASDGEDNEPGAIEQAKKLMKEKKIHIFTLAFGTEKGGAIPYYDNFGQIRGYRKDKSGKVILSKTKGTVLKELARVGKGSFHHVTFGSSAINELREEISELEKTQFESADLVNYDEKFQGFLILGLILAFLELLLGDRKGEGRIWKGRFEVMQR